MDNNTIVSTNPTYALLFEVVYMKERIKDNSQIAWYHHQNQCWHGLAAKKAQPPMIIILIIINI